ncbi:hypothetical protein [Spirosoma utsteinense]|uniref:NH3-dependent NAD+ synthetase n=1 Tax=Spirosoma utsteinense TaxID=2585773 RepID=A0ABR6W2P0_9BACT|nr:hypothetical protein [Spirosoma utsteinense]MBC3788177.1 NH3-dependent NAD+ synthetase [Spirosoma utsteinense]MBC3790474.1 NH3-dependent NAD+ synthetase [Spirosoma utsteinense]
MESLVFHLDADKADQNLIDSIKAYFGTRRVQITVMPDEPTDDVIDPDKDDEADEPDYALPYDEIARITTALQRNEPIDVMAEMKKFMGDK